MGDMLAMLNHLLAAWLAENGSGEGWRFTEARLDAQGGILRAQLQRGGFDGELVLRLEAEPPQGNRQTLHLRVEQWPAQLPAGLAPFRTVLEKARLHLELDFEP